MKPATSLCLFFGLVFLAGVHGQSSCGGLYQSDKGRIQNDNGQGGQCIWVIETLSRQNLNLNLDSLGQDQVLFVYTQDSIKQKSVTPTRLTSSDVGSTVNVQGQSVTLVLPSPAANSSSTESRQISFSWTSVQIPRPPILDLLEGSETEGVSSGNYGQSPEGEIEWSGFSSQQKTTWVLNAPGSERSLSLEIDTEFGECELDNLCDCSNFILYEIPASGLLREVARVCGRPLHIEATKISTQLLAYFQVNPASPRKMREGLTEKVGIKWSNQGSATTTTTAATTTTELPTTTADPGPKLKDCMHIRMHYERQAKSMNGVSPKQIIYPRGPDGPPLKVLCDFSEYGGWTIFQNRGPGPREEFYRGWDDYVKGFGDPWEGNYWLGLENIYQLTNTEVNDNYVQDLMIEVTDWEDRTEWIEFTEFYVKGESKNYALNIGHKHMGTLDEVSLAPHNRQEFTTFDRDNDASSEVNCGELLHSGFWFSSCYNVNLNGFYWNKNETMASMGDGIVWSSEFHGSRYSHQYSQMKLRYNYPHWIPDSN